MSVSFRGTLATAVGATGSSPLTGTEPASASAGDALIAVAVAASGSGLTRPSGWTQLYSGTQGTMMWDVSYIIRTGSAPSLAWTHTGSVFREVMIGALTPTGTIRLDSQSAAGSSASASSSKPDPPATTAVATTSLAFCGGVHFASATWTAQAGYTIRSTAGTQDIALASKALAAAGSEDPAVFGGTLGGADELWNGFTVTFTDDAVTGFVAARMKPILQAVNRAGTY